MPVCPTRASLHHRKPWQLRGSSLTQIPTTAIPGEETPRLWQQLRLLGVQRRQLYLVDYAVRWSIYEATTLLFIFMIMIIKSEAS